MMKITEMSTISFAEFINNAGDHVCNIVQNENFVNLFSEEGMNKNRVVWLVDAAKAICGPCRDDIFAILSALSGKPVEEIEKQSLITTVGMLCAVYKDIKSTDIPE